MAHGDETWARLVQPHRRDLVREGHRLHFVDLPGSGHPVVLLHGYTDSSYSWHATAPALVAAGHRVVMVDLPALGRSTAPPRPHRLTLENQAAAVLELCDHLGLETFDLIGHSMGGAILLHLCLEVTDRLRRAVALAPACRRPKRRMALSYPGVPLLAAAIPPSLVFRAGLRHVYHDPACVTRARVEEYSRPARRRTYWLDVARLTREFFSPAMEAMVQRYAELRPPLLILWGEHDAWLPERLGRWLHRRMPQARYEVISGAGHNLHQERPERVNRLVLEHLR
ncbi:MAG: alpha/beta hydrolase [Deltaproteobacteria bacterium]|jgi:pimeloyl-ACP methyl ester carboxylesterase|nr:alpha/beta hydrolase [Deltaproteobacteria bacterium]